MEKRCFICWKVLGIPDFRTALHCPKLLKLNITTCRKYLQSKIKFTSHLNVPYEQNKTPICPDCYPRTNELLRLHIALQGIQKHIDQIVNAFSEDILQCRSQLPVVEIESIIKKEEHVKDISLRREIPKNLDVSKTLIGKHSSSEKCKESVGNVSDLNDQDQTDLGDQFDSIESNDDTDFMNESKANVNAPLRPIRKAAENAKKKFELYSDKSSGEEVEDSGTPKEEESLNDETNQRLDTLVEDIEMEDVAAKFECKCCGKDFDSAELLRDHCTLLIGDETQFKCCNCEKSFKLEVKLKNHMRLHIDSHRFVCKQCGCGFNSKNYLACHQVKHNGQKIYQCDDCGKVYSYRTGLRNHRLTTHAENSTPYECSTCGKKYKTNTNLMVHMRLHTGERPYTCHVCGSGWRSSSKLVKHVWQVHTRRQKLLSEKIEKESLLMKQHETNATHGEHDMPSTERVQDDTLKNLAITENQLNQNEFVIARTTAPTTNQSIV